MTGSRHIFADPAAAAAACASDILEKLDEALAHREFATLAVSGGSTPRLLFREFAKARFDWRRLHLFWVDERSVPPDHEQSNYRLTQTEFLGPAGFPEANAHRVLTEHAPEEAARLYEDEIRRVFRLEAGKLPAFDVIHQGMGADGHTASLFPGEPLIADRIRIAAAVWSAPMAQWRVTLGPGVLLGARHTVMLATGADKRAALRRVFAADGDTSETPSRLMLGAPDAAWFLDRAASEGLAG